jgi:hypothetical protein
LTNLSAYLIVAHAPTVAALRQRRFVVYDGNVCFGSEIHTVFSHYLQQMFP